jgi:hypothetical protein
MTSRSKRVVIKSEILRVLRARKVRGADLSELITATGGKLWSVAPTITRLHKDGLIEREGSWRFYRYRIASKSMPVVTKEKRGVAHKTKRRRLVAAA